MQPTPSSSSPSHLSGQLLLSTPVIADGLFHKSVVLLTEHDDSGAHGYILNHPTTKTVGQIIKDPKLAPLHDLKVHLGGPIGREHLTFTALSWDESTQSLQYRHRISAKDAIEHQKNPNTLIHPIIGFSGWESGQLENEIEGASWFALPPTEPLIKHPHSPNLWKKTLQEAGPAYQLIANAPNNPFLN